METSFHERGLAGSIPSTRLSDGTLRYCVHVGLRIVIVTHSGALNALYRRTMGIDFARPRDFKIFNASINRFAVSDGQPGRRWQMLRWADVDHLQNIGTIDDS